MYEIDELWLAPVWRQVGELQDAQIRRLEE
jgi:hypothetical protein